MEEYIIQMLRFRIVRRPPLREIGAKIDAHHLKMILGAPEYLKGVAVPTRVLRVRNVTQREFY